MAAHTRITASCALSAVLAFWSGTGIGCMNTEQTTKQGFQDADVVFAGTVTNVEPRHNWVVRTWSRIAPVSLGGNPMRESEALATVRVEQAFKGVVTHAEVKVNTYSGEVVSTCPWSVLRTMKPVLLFARRGQSGQLEVLHGVVPMSTSGVNATLLKELKELAGASGV